MKRPYTVIGILVIVIILIAFGVYAYTHKGEPPESGVTATASYLCRDGKTIDASFTDADVTLTLSDTRALVLPRAVSASGMRYEKDGTAFVGKGDTAYLEENGTQTYADCVANGSPTGSATAPGAKEFTDSAGTFSFTYPDSVTVSGGDLGYTQSWMTNATTSGLVLAKATLSKAFQPNTNFGEATLTVGTSPDPSAVAQCLTYNPSGGPTTAPTKQTINGTEYTVMHSNDAAAGNRYDTTSYRTVRNSQCYAVEYTIHYGNIQNYDPSSGVKEFDESAVKSVMEGVVQSFRFTDGA